MPFVKHPQRSPGERHQMSKAGAPFEEYKIQITTVIGGVDTLVLEASVGQPVRSRRLFAVMSGQLQG